MEQHNDRLDKGTKVLQSPVPLPKPRKKTEDASVNSEAKPEVESNIPVPAPRQRTKIVHFVKIEQQESKNSASMSECQLDDHYQNVIIMRPAPKAPNSGSVIRDGDKLPKKGEMTKISRAKAGTDAPSFSGQQKHNPNLTDGNVRTDRTSVNSMEQTVDEKVDVNKTPAGGKYKTNSPSDLFKTIGTASRMLTESIGERVAHKTKKVAHNVRNTGSNIMAWGHDSRKSATEVLKNVGRSANEKESETTSKEKSALKSTDSPTSPSSGLSQTITSPDMMKKIRFDSPLRDNGLEASSSDLQTTYDTPRQCSKPTNLSSMDSIATSSAPSMNGDNVSHSSVASSEGNNGRGFFHRQTSTSQSLYSRILPKSARRNDPSNIPAPGRLARTNKMKSESNLYESTFYVGRPESSGTSVNLYGKLNIISRPTFSTSSSSSSASSLYEAGSEEDNTLHELLRTRVNLRAKSQVDSPASALASGARNEQPECKTQSSWIFSRRFSADGKKLAAISATETKTQQNCRSESWNFYDINSEEPAGTGIVDKEVEENKTSNSSSREPFSEKSQLRFNPGPIYDHISQNQSTYMLKPMQIRLAKVSDDHLPHDYDEVSISDIIDEFDPLAKAAYEAFIEQSANEAEHSGTAVGGNLALIENLLGAESYSRIPLRNSTTIDCAEPGSEYFDAIFEADGGENERKVPKPPQRTDSLFLSELRAPIRAVPEKPQKVRPRQAECQIIHQNLSLPTGNIGNMVEVDEQLVVPHMAIVSDVPTNEEETADLSYSRGPQSNWYVPEEANDNRNVETVRDLSNIHPQAVGGSGGQPKQHNLNKPTNTNLPHDETIDDSRTSRLPTYFEAISGSEPGRGPTATPAASGSKSTSVATKLLNALKRKPSFNRGTGENAVCVALEMIPKPRLTERHITHKGHVLKFPSGKIGDVLNELSPRSVVLREHIFQTYMDPQQTLAKETILLRYILSVQSILQHKFAGEGRLDLHCFEIVLGVPKGATGTSAGAGSSAMAAAGMSTNPDLLITSGTSANVKLTRQSYMFGTYKRSDRNLWMTKVLQSVTDVFAGNADLLDEFLRAGWCYVKKSITASWSSAWLVLAKRCLYIHKRTDNRLVELDLRKVRCIGVVDNEPETIGNLHVEMGPCLFIDCPPYTTLYFIMGSPRETQIWHKVIRQMAYKNGTSLQSQQLTRGDVPVLVDKCVNFIYAHGSMSEGIYRKSGSQTTVNRILQLFNEDAFSVQLTRNDYNEYDVAGALKKFIRELPGSFFGSHAASFVAIGSLDGGDVQLKLDSYRQLLNRLPNVEHSTLKKLLGHLAFIASLEKHNRMGVPNLAMIWGTTLLANASQNTIQETNAYHQEDATVIADLIRLYSSLFPVDPDELYKEQLMLSVLKKYHSAAENLSDAVKHSGDLKVWITLDCDNPPAEERFGFVHVDAVYEDKLQVNVDITPVKTVADVCKELAVKTKYPWYKLSLYEVIVNDSLMRPIHYSENVLEIIVRWTYWDASDRKNNYLTLKPTTTLNDVYRTIQKAPVLTPMMELKFADRKTKALRTYQLQLVGRGVVVLKKIDKKEKSYEELMKIDLTQMTAYIGCESKRDHSSLRWAITLVDHNFKKRTRDSPFIGHIFGGLDISAQMLWFSSILYSQYKDDILPSGDVLF